jgi:hypothetical protein
VKTREQKEAEQERHYALSSKNEKKNTGDGDPLCFLVEIADPPSAGIALRLRSPGVRPGRSLKLPFPVRFVCPQAFPAFPNPKRTAPVT